MGDEKMKKYGFILLSVMLAVVMVLAGCSQRDGSGSGNSASNTDNRNTSTNTSNNTGSSSSTDKASDGKKKKLTVFSTAADRSVQDLYQEISDAFMQENPDVEVELQFPGSEYENLLKVMMAANDMPDIWDTHGWAIIRYGNYLADLRDEEWVPQMTDTVRNVVTDENGKVHALVLAEAKDGITYNSWWISGA